MPNINPVDITQVSDESMEDDVERDIELNKSVQSSASVSAVSESVVSVSVSGSLSRKRKSPYWDHFVKVDDDGHVKCKYCDKGIRALSKNGTSGMKNHLDKCQKYPPNVDKKQKLIDFESRLVVDKDGKNHTLSVPKLWSFSQDFARIGLARMIIVDELPFMFFEHEGFREFCKRLNPEFVVPSRKTIAKDCYTLFIEQRRELKSFFSTLSSRVSLTTDCWTSGQNLSYMCLTAHFIDNNWKLHKMILNFCPIVGHTGELIGKAVEKCLIEWQIRNVMTITVDNVSSNDVALKYLQSRLNHWGGSVLDSKFLHMRCAAHILNLVVKDGLKDLNSSILKIRTAVKYVRSSPARLQKFVSCIEEEKIKYKGLVCLDVDTRWNSTYLMIASAIKFRKAFDNMHSKGGPYIKEFRSVGGAPMDADWDKVGIFLPFLEIFYTATLKFSGCRYATSNFYVPEMFGIGNLISAYGESDDVGIKSMTFQMKAKLEKYWGNIDSLNLLVFIAFILDPRHKLHYVQFVIGEFYDQERAEKLCSSIDVTLRSLFGIYNALQEKKIRDVSLSDSNSALSTSGVSPHDTSANEQVLDGQQRLKTKYKKIMGTAGNNERKSELEKYLSDDCEPDDGVFDILEWWNDNQKRYPVLALIARDVLAIPVSIVASESAFSTGGRVLDSFRTSLTPRIVEALVCAQDWYRNSNIRLPVEENFLDLEFMEEGMKNLMMEHPVIVVEE